jgi:hypothetical protein
MQINKLEIGFAALLFALGCFIIVQSYLYGILGPTVTDTGFFPLLSGLLLSVASGSILVGFVRGTRSSAETLAFSSLLPIVAIVASTVLFLCLVQTFGMVVLTPIYVGAVAFIVERPVGTRGWLRLLAVAFGFTLFAWLLFDYALRIPLPRSSF